MMYLLFASRNCLVGTSLSSLVTRGLLGVRVLGGATVDHFRVGALLADLLTTLSLSLLGRSLLLGCRLSVGVGVLKVEDINLVLKTEVLSFSKPRLFLRI